MAFLTPLFLLGLAALAIPVLIHLIQRERRHVVRFPSLMFVQRIPYKSVRRRRIHNWLLLMVRLAALAIIVAAFARPFLPRQDMGVTAAGGAREVVILLDQSYSMGYSDRWERARAAAYDAINRLGPADRGSVVLFSSAAEIAARSVTAAERDRLTGSIADAALSSGATRYAPALRVAGTILTESSLPRREAILISDFQRGGWRGEEGARLPTGATLTPILIGGSADAPNVTVGAVSLARSTFANQERVAATASVMNRGTRAMTGGTIALEIGGRRVEMKSFDVDANSSVSVTFAPVTVASRNMRGTVRLGADALAADNAFNFVVSPIQPVRVMVVDRGPEGGLLYLMRALSIGDMPRFETIVRRADAVSDDDLSRASIVVLNDVSVPIGLGGRLARFVENGGGLLVALGSRGTWPSEADVLPATLGPAVDRTRGDAARIGGLEYAHPVFELFRSPRSGDFSAVRFYGYRAVTPVASSQVLARFDAGSPALVERRVGSGRVLLWASMLDISWSDFPQKPIFLPFVHRVARYLAAYTEPLPWLTVGQVLDVAALGGTGAGSTDMFVLTPSGRRMSINEEEGLEVVELAEQGFYELRRQPGDPNVRVVASNVDPAESDLTAMDPREIVAAVSGEPSAAGRSTNVPLTPETQERLQGIWWYLLFTGILLLALDTVLSNRLSRRRSE